MEINVNDYVRIDGYISKIEHLRTLSSGKTYAQWKQPNGLLASGNINIIEKSSPRIIDLIEVGDYVNGKEIIEISESGKVLFYQDFDIIKSIENDSIKSVLTKEMFEQMEYKID